MRVTLTYGRDRVVFRNGMPGDWDADCWITAGGLTGWYGSPGIRVDKARRPWADGDWWPSHPTQEGRTVTIKAGMRCESSIDMAQALARLNRMVGQRVTMQVEDEAGVLHCDCLLMDDIEPSLHYSRGWAWFTLILYAPDPHKYGRPVVAPVTDGLAHVSNMGGLPVWPVLDVSGHATGVEARLGESLVQWRGDAADGIRLDFASLDPSTGTMVSDDAFMLPVGESVVSVQVAGQASASVAVTPAWR